MTLKKKKQKIQNFGLFAAASVHSRAQFNIISPKYNTGCCTGSPIPRVLITLFLLISSELVKEHVIFALLPCVTNRPKKTIFFPTPSFFHSFKEQKTEIRIKNFFFSIFLEQLQFLTLISSVPHKAIQTPSPGKFFLPNCSGPLGRSAHKIWD